MQNRLLAKMAPMKGWLRVGSNGAGLGVKKISWTMARTAKRIIEQLEFSQSMQLACSGRDVLQVIQRGQLAVDEDVEVAEKPINEGDFQRRLGLF